MDFLQLLRTEKDFKMINCFQPKVEPTSKMSDLPFNSDKNKRRNETLLLLSVQILLLPTILFVGLDWKEYWI